jgi:hypothetical protein
MTWIQIFGDVDVDSLVLRMKCETGGEDHGMLQVSPGGCSATDRRAPIRSGEGRLQAAMK